jgi:hypothetical protein
MMGLSGVLVGADVCNNVGWGGSLPGVTTGFTAMVSVGAFPGSDEGFVAVGLMVGVAVGLTGLMVGVAVGGAVDIWMEGGGALGVAVGTVVGVCAVNLSGIGGNVGRYGRGVTFPGLPSRGVAVTFSGKGTGVAVDRGLIFLIVGLALVCVKAEPADGALRQAKRTAVQSKTDSARYFIFIPNPPNTIDVASKARGSRILVSLYSKFTTSFNLCQ